MAATGVTPEPASAALSVLDADFSPAVPGRQVLLQRQSGKSWATVQQQVQAADGGVSFTAPYASAGAPIFSDEFAGETLTPVWEQPNAPTALGADPSVSGAEIDIIEWFGTGSPGLADTIYYYRSGAQVKHGGVIPAQETYGDGWVDQFHVFSVEWTPTSYVFRIDGKETFRTSEGISRISQYVILSLLSSDYELAHIKDMSLLPQTTQVDWVRVWGQS
ncbi:MAG: hypothetical protein JWN68_3057 [Nocardioides sp.]|jgi:hypothetical protein|uniref:glycoside hydrolase family 16 protein n=1 Tax=Nocardioides sp. TaxID=35761 RepID=UPI0026210311|nr:glycoside hydrolase family 16 protein [Nocardioides sp.]MCW2835104.1 hypothetical protein [Nocardioides sp.]